jgi:dTDP-L-rhamnose 4-epimerase
MSKSLQTASRRVLITGGAGFIGSHLARRLEGAGHSVRVLDNLLPQVHGKVSRPNLPGCQTSWADVTDVEAVARIMEGSETLFHLAAQTGVGQSQYEIGSYVFTNTYGTAVVLEAAVAAGVRHLIIGSSRAVYGEGQYRCLECQCTFVPDGRSANEMDHGRWEINCPHCGQPATPVPTTEDVRPAPSSVYGLTKLQQEQLAHIIGRTHNLPVTVLRFFNVFGPGQSLRNPYTGVLGTFFRRAMAGLPVEIYEDGHMLRDFVFVDDVVDALELCMRDERASVGTFNVGSGEAVTILQIAEELFRPLNLKRRVTVSGRYRLGDVRHAIADVSGLNIAVGYRPQTEFARGLRLYVEWAKENQTDAADELAAEQLAGRNLLRQGRG